MVNAVATASMVLLVAGSVSAAEIDACKYLLVSNLAEDPYEIVAELRAQGRTRGFIVITSRVPRYLTPPR